MKRLLSLIASAAIGYGIFRLFKKVQQMRNTNQVLTFFNAYRDKLEEDDLFDGGSYASVFGALDIDLSNAVISDDVAIVEIESMFSGIRLLVPPTWKIKLDGTIKQSVIRNNIDEDVYGNDQPVLIVKYKLLCSELKVDYAKFKHAKEEPSDDDSEKDISERYDGTIIDEVM